MDLVQMTSYLESMAHKYISKFQSKFHQSTPTQIEKSESFTQFELIVIAILLSFITSFTFISFLIWNRFVNEQNRKLAVIMSRLDQIVSTQSHISSSFERVINESQDPQIINPFDQMETIANWFPKPKQGCLITTPSGSSISILSESSNEFDENVKYEHGLLPNEDLNSIDKIILQDKDEQDLMATINDDSGIVPDKSVPFDFINNNIEVDESDHKIIQ